MLIQTLPPRRMWRVIAIRADSICRFVTYAGSSAWMPNSPNVTFVPPLAAPERSGWCCLRCLTRRGISISALLSGRDGRCGLTLGRYVGGLAARVGTLAGGPGDGLDRGQLLALRAGPARVRRA